MAFAGLRKHIILGRDLKMPRREQSYFVKDAKFIPEQNDIFRFCFHRNECCKEHNGTCPIEDLSLMDIYFIDNLQKGRIPEENTRRI